MNEFTTYREYSEHCIKWVQKGIENYLDSRLSEENILSEAIRYSVKGGKRIRAMLAHAACILAGGNPNDALSAACAIEFMHSYSLIHDDLPSMDNADFRRGQPSCYKTFGEAQAILAGDALQTLAFEILATSVRLEETAKLKQIARLARASGCQGMLAGQSQDINLINVKNITLDHLKTINCNKTGALITASLAMGAYAANANNEIHKTLATYGNYIGLAFQIQDDILDSNKDSEQQFNSTKPTYVSILGIDKANHHLHTLLSQACNALNSFNNQADPLHWIANYIIKRGY